MDKYDQLCDKYFKTIDKEFMDNHDEEKVDVEEVDQWLKDQRLDYID